MATHDYVIDNSTGANVRADINSVLQAILTNNSSSSSPSTTAAYMFWADTTSGTLKIRNSSNNAWVELLQLDGTLTLEDGSVSAPALAFRDDLNTGIFSSAADEFNIATGGVERVSLSSGATVFNQGGSDTDFRVESDTNTHMLFVDSGNNRVGIGTSSPGNVLDVSGTISGSNFLLTSTAGTYGVLNDTSIAFFGSASTGIMQFKTNGDNERMRIDSSGRLLLGTTTASAFTDRLLTVASSGSAGIEMRAGTSSISQLSFSDGSGNDVSGYRGFISYQHGSDLMQIGAGSAARINIDSSGNVAIGTTTISNQRLKVDGNVVVDNGTVRCNDGFSSDVDVVLNSDANNNGTGSIIFKESGSEKLRINSDGTLFMNKTAQNSGGAGVELYQDGPNFMTRNGATVLGLNNQSGTTGDIMRFYFQNAHRGNLNFNGSTFAATTASDYRLKENDVSITDGIERVKQLRPIRFNFIKDSSKTLDGFFAHEVQKIVPDCVIGEKDSKISAKGEGYQHISKEGLIPLLTAAIKELIIRVESLEAA